MMRKIIAFLISFCLVFEQAGFAQVAPQLGVPAYLNRFAPVPDAFRPIHLRALTIQPQINNFDLLLDKGDNKDLKPPQIQSDAQKLLEYFRVGLVLPNSAFWVNLRPDAPEDIIDPEVEKTDIGRIFLEADLQLKKDMARFTSPETPEGRQYWDKLYEKAEEIFGPADVSIPTITRPWIVPGEIIVGESKDGAYIYKATLKVMLEQDYLQGSVEYSFEDERLKQLNDYSSEILRQLIIPKLTREVNAAKRYAPLRQVYYSLILAQWFKGKFGDAGKQVNKLTSEQVKTGSLLSSIDSRNLGGLESKRKWQKETYYKAYQKSFKNGEYSLDETVYNAYGMTMRRYFSGGLAIKAIDEAIIAPLSAQISGVMAGSQGPQSPFLIKATFDSGTIRVSDAPSAPVLPEQETSAGGTRSGSAALDGGKGESTLSAADRDDIKGVLQKALKPEGLTSAHNPPSSYVTANKIKKRYRITESDMERYIDGLVEQGIQSIARNSDIHKPSSARTPDITIVLKEGFFRKGDIKSEKMFALLVHALRNFSNQDILINTKKYKIWIPGRTAVQGYPTYVYNSQDQDKELYHAFGHDGYSGSSRMLMEKHNQEQANEWDFYEREPEDYNEDKDLGSLDQMREFLSDNLFEPLVYLLTGEKRIAQIDVEVTDEKGEKKTVQKLKKKRKYVASFGKNSISGADITDWYLGKTGYFLTGQKVCFRRTSIDAAGMFFKLNTDAISLSRLEQLEWNFPPYLDVPQPILWALDYIRWYAAEIINKAESHPAHFEENNNDGISPTAQADGGVLSASERTEYDKDVLDFIKKLDEAGFRLQPIDLKTELAQSGLTEEQTKKLFESSEGKVMTIYDFLRLAQTRDFRKQDGYALGLNETRNFCSILTDMLGLKHYIKAYSEHLPGEYVNTPEFIRIITSLNKPIVFFVPRNVLTFPLPSFTTEEMRELLQTPERMKNVYFVFGAYETIGRNDMERYFYPHLGATAPWDKIYTYIFTHFEKYLPEAKKQDAAALKDGGTKEILITHLAALFKSGDSIAFHRTLKLIAAAIHNDHGILVQPGPMTQEKITETIGELEQFSIAHTQRVIDLADRGPDYNPIRAKLESLLSSLPARKRMIENPEKLWETEAGLHSFIQQISLNENEQVYETHLQTLRDFVNGMPVSAGSIIRAMIYLTQFNQGLVRNESELEALFEKAKKLEAQSWRLVEITDDNYGYSDKGAWLFIGPALRKIYTFKNDPRFIERIKQGAIDVSRLDGGDAADGAMVHQDGGDSEKTVSLTQESLKGFDPAQAGRIAQALESRDDVRIFEQLLGVDVGQSIGLRGREIGAVVGGGKPATYITLGDNARRLFLDEKTHALLQRLGMEVLLLDGNQTAIVFNPGAINSVLIKNREFLSRQAGIELEAPLEIEKLRDVLTAVRENTVLMGLFLGYPQSAVALHLPGTEQRGSFVLSTSIKREHPEAAEFLHPFDIFFVNEAGLTDGITSAVAMRKGYNNALKALDTAMAQMVPKFELSDDVVSPLTPEQAAKLRSEIRQGIEEIGIEVIGDGNPEHFARMLAARFNCGFCNIADKADVAHLEALCKQAAGQWSDEEIGRMLGQLASLGTTLYASPTLGTPVRGESQESRFLRDLFSASGRDGFIFYRPSSNVGIQASTVHEMAELLTIKYGGLDKEFSEAYHHTNPIVLEMELEFVRAFYGLTAAERTLTDISEQAKYTFAEPAAKVKGDALLRSAREFLRLQRDSEQAKDGGDKESTVSKKPTVPQMLNSITNNARSDSWIVGNPSYPMGAQDLNKNDPMYQELLQMEQEIKAQQAAEEIKKAQAEIKTAAENYTEAIQGAIKENNERKAMFAYKGLMEQLSKAFGQVSFIYPLMGLDIIPSFFHRTFSINPDKHDLERGTKLSARIFGNIGLTPNVYDNARRDLFADADSYLSDIKKFSPNKKVVVLKGVTASNASSEGKATDAIKRLYDEALSEGDVVVVLHSQDKVFGTLAISAGFSEIYAKQLIDFKNEDMKWAEEDFKVLLFPDTLQVYVKDRAGSRSLRDGGETASVSIDQNRQGLLEKIAEAERNVVMWQDLYNRFSRPNPRDEIPGRMDMANAYLAAMNQARQDILLWKAQLEGAESTKDGGYIWVAGAEYNNGYDSLGAIDAVDKDKNLLAHIMPVRVEHLSNKHFKKLIFIDKVAEERDLDLVEELVKIGAYGNLGQKIDLVAIDRQATGERKGLHELLYSNIVVINGNILGLDHNDRLYWIEGKTFGQDIAWLSKYKRNIDARLNSRTAKEMFGKIEQRVQDELNIVEKQRAKDRQSGQKPLPSGPGTLSDFLKDGGETVDDVLDDISRAGIKNIIAVYIRNGEAYRQIQYLGDVYTPVDISFVLKNLPDDITPRRVYKIKLQYLELPEESNMASVIASSNKDVILLAVEGHDREGRKFLDRLDEAYKRQKEESQEKSIAWYEEFGYSSEQDEPDMRKEVEVSREVADYFKSISDFDQREIQSVVEIFLKEVDQAIAADSDPITLRLSWSPKGAYTKYFLSKVADSLSDEQLLAFVTALHGHALTSEGDRQHRIYILIKKIAFNGSARIYPLIEDTVFKNAPEGALIEFRKRSRTDAEEWPVPYKVGEWFDAHGIVDKSEGAKERLIKLLQNGIDQDRLLHAAPLMASDKEKGTSPFGTHHAFNKGPFIIVGHPPEPDGEHGKPLQTEGIRYVIVNSNYLGSVEALSTEFPGVEFILAREAPVRFCQILLGLDNEQVNAAKEAGAPDRQYDGGKGGIDLRNLPIATQPAIGAAPGAIPVGVPTINITDLDKEWSQIQKQMQAEAMPYGKIKEYVTCCKQHNAQEKLDAVLACIANILRLEEERAVPTAPELKEILVSIG